MVEYVYYEDDGLIEVRVDEENFMEYAPIIGDIYDYGFDGIFVYLEEREDYKARSLLMNYYQRKVKDVEEAEIKDTDPDEDYVIEN